MGLLRLYAAVFGITVYATVASAMLAAAWSSPGPAVTKQAQVAPADTLHAASAEPQPPTRVVDPAQVLQPGYLPRLEPGYDLRRAAAGEAKRLVLKPREQAQLEQAAGLTLDFALPVQAGWQRLVTRLPLASQPGAEGGALVEYVLSPAAHAQRPRPAAYRAHCILAIGYDARGPAAQQAATQRRVMAATLLRGPGGRWRVLDRHSTSWCNILGAYVLDLNADGTTDLALSQCGAASSGGGVLLLSLRSDGTLEPLRLDCPDAGGDAGGVLPGLLADSASGELFSVYGHLRPLDLAGDGRYALEYGRLSLCYTASNYCSFGLLSYAPARRGWVSGGAQADKLAREQAEFYAAFAAALDDPARQCNLRGKSCVELGGAYYPVPCGSGELRAELERGGITYASSGGGM